MAKSNMQKFTVKDFQQVFPDDDSCLDYIRQQKYPERIDCPSCSKNALFHKIKERKSYACDYCGYQIAPMAGTIFEKSSTPLTLWFYAIYLMAQTRGGISAKQIERETGVTYKTAWRMCKEIRHCLDEDFSPFTGDVELDESYFGGRKHGKRGRGAEGKTAVFGMAQRAGRVKARVVPNVRRKSIMPIIESSVNKTARVFTDERNTYAALPAMGYAHGSIPHAQKVYVMGDVHTNTIEGFWSNVKNGIRGVYHSVSSRYLQSYLNEYAFRYNHRKDITPMFWFFLRRSVFHRAS
ncbi:MAG: IS1595 family transposase [Anaerolineales bacterium]|nr:MAG: IS1595 family transposase [Anaerolineales bacterium]